MVLNWGNGVATVLPLYRYEYTSNTQHNAVLKKVDYPQLHKDSVIRPGTIDTVTYNQIFRDWQYRHPPREIVTITISKNLHLLLSRLVREHFSLGLKDHDDRNSKQLGLARGTEYDRTVLTLKVTKKYSTQFAKFMIISNNAANGNKSVPFVHILATLHPESYSDCIILRVDKTELTAVNNKRPIVITKQIETKIGGLLGMDRISHSLFAEHYKK